jgi:hypothetical protein
VCAEGKLDDIKGIDELEQEEMGLGPEMTASDSQDGAKREMFIDRLKRMVRRSVRGPSPLRSDEGEDPDACLNEFGNIKGAGSSPDLPPLQPLNPGLMPSVMTANSGYSGGSMSPRRNSTQSFMSQTPSGKPSFAGSRRGSSFIDGTLDIEIVDLRLFDFLLPKGEAKIEITYIAVNDRKEEEQIVLIPDQVKEVHILLDGLTETPINPLGFTSDSSSFPLTQTWTRPKGLKYPVQAEITLELGVKNTRCVTRPHQIVLTGTTSMFDYCVTT